jgi:hypothetical protein
MEIRCTNGFGKEYLTVAYDEACRWVYANWKGYQTFGGVVAGANTVLEVLQQHACPYLLNDNRLVLGPWDHAVQWIAQDWAPRAIASGVTHFAHVVPPASLAAESARAMHLGVSGELEIRLFEDVGEAEAWLQRAQKGVRAASTT